MIFDSLIKKLVQFFAAAGGFSSPEDIARAKRQRTIQQAARLREQAARLGDAGKAAEPAPPGPESVK